MTTLIDKLKDARSRMFRIKQTENINKEGGLERCLSTTDLTLMAIGGMVGSGIYIMTGIAIKEIAGPSIILSFIGAAIIIGLIIMCFTEFASRIHQTGGIYVYTYMTLGEFPAFLMGIKMVIGCLFGQAVNARALSAYVDLLTGHAISNGIRNNVNSVKVTPTFITISFNPSNRWHPFQKFGAPFSDQIDLLSALVILIVMVIVCSGAKSSARLNHIFASFNITVLFCIIVMACIFGSFSNWSITPNSLNSTINDVSVHDKHVVDRGGFLPFGWNGVVQDYMATSSPILLALIGIVTCFWAYAGFEVIATSVEETINPRKSIPLASIATIFCVGSLYIATTVSLTILIPYTDIDMDVPIPSVLVNIYPEVLKTIVTKLCTIGPLFGMSTVILSSIYGNTRMVYAMSNDGLLPKLLAKTHVRTKVPIYTTIIGGFFSATVAATLEIKTIVVFGVTLMLTSYILIAYAIIVLRYSFSGLQSINSEDEDDVCGNVKANFKWIMPKYFDKVEPSTTVTIATRIYVFVAIILSIVIFENEIFNKYLLIVTIVTLVIIILILGLVIAAHKQNKDTHYLKVPFVPFIPMITILICLCLITSTFNWFILFSLATLFIFVSTFYCLYGLKYSRHSESETGSESDINLL